MNSIYYFNDYKILKTSKIFFKIWRGMPEDCKPVDKSELC